MINSIEAKRLTKTTQRLVGEIQLRRYGKFFDNYESLLCSYERTLKNLYFINVNPVTLQIKPFEDITLPQIIHSDNKLLSRILLSLSSICNEIIILTKEAKFEFYKPLVYYGEENCSNGENFDKLSDLFELLQRIQFYIKRSQNVITLLLQQLCALLGKGLYLGSSTTLFPEPLDYLSELLVSLLNLDSLLKSETIKEHWMIYRRHVRLQVLNNSQNRQVRALDKKLNEIENEILGGTILQRCLENCLDENVLAMVKNCNLINEIYLFITQILTELENDDENISFTQIWLQVNSLFVFHHSLSCKLDKRLLKRLMEINKKVSACTLSGSIVWYPEEFLLQHFPNMNKFIDIKALITTRTTLLVQKAQNINKLVNQYSVQACLWFIEFENTLKKDMTQFTVKQLLGVSSLLTEGIKLVKKNSEFIKWITSLHANEAKPMTKSIIVAICKLVEILKCFQFIFDKNIYAITYVMVLIMQYLTYKALTLLASMKKSYTQEKTYKEQQLDVLSAIVVAERALKGPNIPERILVAKLSLSASGLPCEALTNVRIEINRLELTCNLLELLKSLTNCSFLYWHQVLFPVYFQKIIESRSDVMESYLLFEALSDCTYFRKKSKHEVPDVLESSLLSPLNQLIESHLRLQSHLHLKFPESNPFLSKMPQNLKKIHPVVFGACSISIKNDAEHYLSKVFYNLTTVILHDWRTYGEMRCLGALQYNLNTVEDNLPVQTLDQGLDVLEIMRNINVFVVKYLYNLNNQVFIEEWSSNKSLNTINISHVANSIRTHGIGIMSTTVNFTYQFLQNKFFIFSQFMFDEQIKSRLLKDLRFFTEHKADLNQLYPYVRAEKFNHGIRRLGLNENGLSYLDLFRKLITQIGNAMGYVRLIRSGGKRCVAHGTCFLPDLKAIDTINELIDISDLPNLTQLAANALKQEINNLVDNFEEATEYFKLLINVFAPTFRDPQNIHLRNFYVIVPPLTINFIEHSLTCKEKLNKQNREGAAFTDDGFAMGLAYIIELLDQGSQLNSLHWFQSVQIKHKLDRHALDVQKNKASQTDIKLQQTLSLTEKKINSIEMEFKLFYYNFSSARIFFQS